MGFEGEGSRAGFCRYFRVLEDFAGKLWADLTRLFGGFGDLQLVSLK